MKRPVSSQSHSSREYLQNDAYLMELELELEASDNTLVQHEEAVMRASEHHNPFSASKLELFYQMSEQAVDTAMRFERARTQRAQNTDRRSAKLRTSKDGYQNNQLPRVNNAVNDRQWKLVKEHADIRVYRHAQRRGKSSTMMAQGMIRGSLAEIMDGLYAETTKEARVLYGLLSEKYVDAAVLHVDSYRTAQHPFQFSGVTWMGMESPRASAMCKDRDFLVFKKLGTLKDDQGEEVGYITLQSMDGMEATSKLSKSTLILPSSNFVRGYVSVAAFFRRLPNGLVSMFLHGDFNALGYLAMPLADSMFAELAFSIANAAHCGQAKSLAALLQSISANQLPSGGVAGNGHVSNLLPLLSDKMRDRCGVCCKTLWRVFSNPEFCRSCWTRTCGKCKVVLPVYCADYHRAHDEDASGCYRKGSRRIPKPCKETFCLKCVCSVLPNTIKMNAKLMKQTAKKKKRTKKSGSVGTDPSMMRHGLAHHGPSALSASRVSRSSDTISEQRARAQVLVQIPRRGGSRLSHLLDDHSSISVLSSAESDKHKHLRLSLTKAPKHLQKAQQQARQPLSMFETLENFQLNQLSVAATGRYQPPSEHHEVASTAMMSFKSANSFASSENLLGAHRNTPLRVDLTPRKRRRQNKNATPPRRGPNAKVLSPAKKYDDAYYNKVLQRFLQRRRTMSGGIHSAAGSSSMSMYDLLERDMTIKSGVSDVGASSAAIDTFDTNRSINASFLDRPLTPSGISISSFSSTASSDLVAHKYVKMK
ncbi:hypothetical protein Poli38472_001913 [Pythium oligandrum]|uniref:Uncharacterized protein n=1 Tax=Pythium oligandrum TaxID=41045 RepID=A0A8K1CTQ0_PYTOL|nr:hypothetical protein Poli38472_001913 [Pythium oligandrum]|eukprot:TMW69757.1 hypothetical protein Poli38472_001913 [Pythium oligandrum]